MPKLGRPAAKSRLEIAARRLANDVAREEYGEAGFCFRLARFADTRYFRAYIAHRSSARHALVGKTVVVRVEG